MFGFSDILLTQMNKSLDTFVQLQQVFVVSFPFIIFWFIQRYTKIRFKQQNTIFSFFLYFIWNNCLYSRMSKKRKFISKLLFCKGFVYIGCAFTCVCVCMYGCAERDLIYCYLIIVSIRMKDNKFYLLPSLILLLVFVCVEKKFKNYLK